VSPGLLGRLGLALLRPREALVLAGDRRHPGRSGSDLLAAIVVLLVATELRALAAAAWLGTAVDLSFGARALVQILTGTLTVALGLLVVGALALFLGAGPRRDLGRAFDLACVAALPIIGVRLVAGVALGLLGLALPGIGVAVLSALAYAWAGMLLVVAVPVARTRRVPAQVPAGTRTATRAGLALAVVAAVGLVGQVAWIARHLDEVRPMTAGDAAPAFALPRIGPNGALGAPVALASTAGHVTIIDFWATWCGPCLASLPHLDDLAHRHPDVTILAVNLDDPAQARVLFDERGYRMTLLADDGQTSTRYGVTTIPHTVVIDRTGRVVRVARGGRVDLEHEIAPLLAPAGSEPH